MTAGLANYQATLGSWLGGELYRAVSRNLTAEKLAGFVTQGLDAAIQTGTRKAFLSIDGEVDESAVDDFAQALADQYSDLGAKWLETEDGRALVESLQGWVDAHPATVATVALLAAGAAVLANAPIPEITQKFRLPHGFDAEVAARVGKLRAVALEKVKAKLSYKSDMLVAAIQLDHERGASPTGTFDATYGREDSHQLKVDGKLSEAGLELYDVTGIYRPREGREARVGVTGGADTDTTIKAAIQTVDGDVTTSHDVEYDTDSRVLTVRDAATILRDGSRLDVTTSMASTGAVTGSFMHTRQHGTEGLESRVGAEFSRTPSGSGSAWDDSTEQKLKLGMTYTRADLQAELDAVLASTGEHSLTGSVEKDFGGNWKGGANFELTAADGGLAEIGAFYGFQDPEEFETWLARYKYTKADGKHQVDLLIEKKLGEIYARLQQQAAVSKKGNEATTTAQAGYFLNEDVAIFGGLGYQRDTRGTHHFIPQAGVQVGGVPVSVSYDTATRAVSVGITLKFGR
ncbi:MAG: hypothetical protein D6798_11225 [Deltaproteobacteria bacterium]|nr:MAG: hypothetical protein D6798_11225 [Deltaproteobacteria bacterium]